jgi:Methyltransferase domain
MTKPAASFCVKASQSERPFLLVMPILERMRRVEGWLTDAEGDLLVAGVARALASTADTAVVVEVGSYCGRSTVVLGSVVQALAPSRRVYAIDPHEGEVGAADIRVTRTAPTLARFNRTIAESGLNDVVESIQQRPYERAWDREIAFLLVDGLHDYANVSRDLLHFEAWLVDGGYVAFHDYADYYPGVKAVVSELLATRRYERVELAESLILIRRRAEPADP